MSFEIQSNYNSEYTSISQNFSLLLHLVLATTKDPWFVTLDAAAHSDTFTN